MNSTIAFILGEFVGVIMLVLGMELYRRFYENRR